MISLFMGIGLFILAVAAITIIAAITLDYLKHFRTKSGTEMVTMGMKDIIKTARASGSTMSLEQLEALEDKTEDAEYVTAEWDPYEEEVLKVEGARDADSKIKKAVKNANNNVLVIQ